MSGPYEETLNDLVADLLADHLSRAGGGMVTAFHLVAEYVDGDGDEGWLYSTLSGQQQTRTLGLIHWSKGVAEYEQARYMDEITGR